ncbi:MAG TPA: CinA family nicotinamide mononucleotide deamidase-related protein [Chloroflexi bacterium]|nr:CinA family nicotinamide mononucleotide deamidase-related protein [Chloroflexota bacterium]
MPSAEILTIGTELLLGEIVDTNSRYIARRLRDAGIDLYRTTTVGDNAARIAQAVREALDRADIVITTGGLGPTVDDPTRQAVADAVGVPLEFRPELWKAIQERFAQYGRQPTENNRRQAFIPQGAQAIHNPVGTAPAFAVETPDGVVISLPGVPREMEYLFTHEVLPYLQRRFNLRGVILARVLHTAGMPESALDEQIGDLERLSNPTVGLLAHPGQVDIRITAKAESEEVAQEMIAEVEAELRRRLGTRIYGADGETLESVLSKQFAALGLTFTVLEAGLGGLLLQRVGHVAGFLGGKMEADPLSPEVLATRTRACCDVREADWAVGVSLFPAEGANRCHVVLARPEGDELREFHFGGPPQMAPNWATNMVLNLLRRRLLEMEDTP